MFSLHTFIHMYVPTLSLLFGVKLHTLRFALHLRNLNEFLAICCYRHVGKMTHIYYICTYVDKKITFSENEAFRPHATNSIF
jgi:hypothetical protein